MSDLKFQIHSDYFRYTPSNQEIYHERMRIQFFKNTKWNHNETTQNQFHKNSFASGQIIF